VTDDIEGKSFRWLFDTSADALLIVDRDGRISLANPVAEATFGYSRTQLRALCVEDLIPERFRTRHHQLRASFFNSPKPRTMMNALKAYALRADGSELAVDVKLAPVGEGQVLVSVHDASARQQAERALQASEDQLRLLVSGVRDYAIFMLDPDGSVATWNEGAQRIKGYSPEEIVGRHYSAFFTAEEIEAGRPQQILAATRRDGRFEEEGVRVRKDGSRFFAHVVITALYDERGQLRGYGKVTRDVTAQHWAQEELAAHRLRLEEMVTRRTFQLERQTQLLRSANANLSEEIEKRAATELALRESERRYREIFENASDSMFVVEVTSDGRFRNVDANPAFEKATGIPLAEFPGTYVEDTLPPESATQVVEKFRQCVGGAGAIEHEIELEVPAGRRVFRATLVPVSEGAGVRRIIGVTRDITERKLAEQALRDSEERFRLLLESAGEGIYGLDTEGRCTFVNGAALAMIGRTRAEVVGQDVHGLIHHSRTDGSPNPPEECRMCDAFRSGHSRERIIETLWRGDGTSFVAEYSARPMYAEGHITGAVIVFRDVTEQRALTQRLAYEATHDGLTGLVNRPEFERRLERAIADARRGRAEHAVAFLDLDHFKIINDNCGHAAGDQMLHHIGRQLFEHVRARDTLARLGGDEFAVLLEHCPFDQARRIAEELRAAVTDHRFACEGREYDIGVSIGLVPLSESTESPAAVLRDADAACYSAKRQGRNRVHAVDPAPRRLWKIPDKTSA
jgi:diguanylate cyclase (GGDEF)-like protein/PAS domain S-box-containing protein